MLWIKFYFPFAICLYSSVLLAQTDTIGMDLGGESVATSFGFQPLPAVISQQQWARSMINLDRVVVSPPNQFATVTQSQFVPPYEHLPIHEIATDYAELQRYFLFRGYQQSTDTLLERRRREMIPDFGRLEALNYPIVRPRLDAFSGRANVRFTALVPDTSRLDSAFSSAVLVAEQRAALWRALFAAQRLGDPESFEPEFSFERYAFASRRTRRELIGSVLLLVKAQVDTFIAPLKQQARDQEAALDLAYAEAHSAGDVNALADVLGDYQALLAEDPEFFSLKRRVLKAIDSLPADWQQSARILQAQQAIDDFRIRLGGIQVEMDEAMFFIDGHALALVADRLGQSPLSENEREWLKRAAVSLVGSMAQMRDAQVAIESSYRAIVLQITATEDSLFRWALQKYEQPITATNTVARQIQQLSEGPAEATNYLQLLLLAENLKQLDEFVQDASGVGQALEWRAAIKEHYLLALRAQEQRFLQLRAEHN